MEQVSNVDYKMEIRQEIAFDTDIFRELLLKSNEDFNNVYFELIKILERIQDFHEIAINSKWLSEIEVLETLNIDYNLLNIFQQLLLRNDRIKFLHVNSDESSDKDIYEIANALFQNILVSDKNNNVKYKLNKYNKTQFISDNYNNDCVLFRLPKTTDYNSGDILKNLNFFGFYLKNCNFIEFVDPYLIQPNYNSSLDFTLCILDQISGDLDVCFHYDIDKSINSEYENFCKIIKSHKPNIRICSPQRYNKKNNHDRFIIINKEFFSLKFTSSFNNIVKNKKVFNIKKNFSIIIKKGRLYQD